MKKIKSLIKILIFIIIIVLIINFIIYLTTNKKETNYKIDNFNIYEKYTKDNNYYIEITYKKYKFSFINDHNYYKKMNIVEDIKYIKEKDLFCIYPIFKNNINSEIICSKNNKYYNYYGLLDNKRVKTFIKSLNMSDRFQESTKYKEYNNMKIYNNNLIDNTYIVIWNYTGIDIISKNYNTFKITNNDIYNNKLGILIDKYYITPSYENNFDFNKILEINITKNKQKEYELDNTISFDSYINGVIDNEIYFMDKDNLVQYKYNLDKHKIIEVGNKELNGTYYKNNKKETINIYNLKKEEIYFENDIKLKKLSDYNIKEVYSYLNRYYFVTLDNKVYTTYNENISNPIFLFKASDIKEIKLIDDYLYFIDEDNIYMYNRYYGLKKLITKNELKYNYKNIYSVYIEK